MMGAVFETEPGMCWHHRHSIADVILNQPIRPLAILRIKR